VNGKTVNGNGTIANGHVHGNGSAWNALRTDRGAEEFELDALISDDEEDERQHGAEARRRMMGEKEAVNGNTRL